MNILHEYISWDLVEMNVLQECTDNLCQTDSVMTVAVLVHAVTVLLAPH